ncbi:hypothetical protein TNCV_523961 [Trichonephila clavipes]|nr:hypothetical protein TNCV_523961 [Trichonephila clavipes]
MLSRPYPARDLNPGHVAWTHNTLPLSQWSAEGLMHVKSVEREVWWVWREGSFGVFLTVAPNCARPVHQ